MSTPNTELRTDERADNSQSLGTQLRAAREARGVPLREISDQTRIAMRHLEAIESDSYKELPGGIFNRSFIKSYARYVRFDEARALELYNRTARERGEDTEVVPTVRERVYMNGDSNRSPLATGVMVVVLLAVLAGGVYAGLRWWQSREATQQVDTRPANNVSVAPTPQTTQTVQPNNVIDPATQGLNVRVTVRGSEPVWVSTRADSANAIGAPIQPNASRDVSGRERVVVRYAKAQARNLEVLINNRAARVPSDQTEMSITPDTVQQYLQ